MKLLLLCAVLAGIGLENGAYGLPGCRLYGKYPAKSPCCHFQSRNCCRDYGSGKCYCSPAPATHSLCFNGTSSGEFYLATATNDKCCGILYVQRGVRSCLYGILCRTLTVYTYRPSPLEKNGLCKREPRLAYNRPYYTVQPNTGSCLCKRQATSCFNQTITTPAPTTAKPTTTPIPRVCPAAPPSSFARVLGGTLVGDECTVNGIINFRLGEIQICNGVLGYDPATKTNKMYITDYCIRLLKFVSRIKSVEAIGLYNRVPFQITTDTVTTEVVNSISTLAPPAGVLRDSRCKTTACVYNAATMSKLIDLDSCYLTSFGYDFQIGGVTINSHSVNKVNLKQTSTCMTAAATANAKCFTATDSKVRGCWGDNGAPVFCKLSSTNETVLYGMVDVIGTPPQEVTGTKPADLCGNNNEFHVLPVA